MAARSENGWISQSARMGTETGVPFPGPAGEPSLASNVANSHPVGEGGDFVFMCGDELLADETGVADL